MRGLLLVFLFLYWSSLCAQVTIESPTCAKETKERVEKHRALGIMLTGDLTYIGYSTALTLEYERRKHSFYIGPKISITETYIPQKGPIGGNIGYRYFFVNNLKRWKIYINGDYQSFIYKAFPFQGAEKNNKKNFIHEINIGYGVQYLITERIYIGNSIGLGKYYESYYSYKANDRVVYSGYDALIRLFVKYKL